MPFMLRVLVYSLVIYGALLLLIYLMQPRLLFLPGVAGRDLTVTPEAVNLPYSDVFLQTEDGETLHGWWLPHDQHQKSTTATVLFFHGNAGNVSHRLDSLRIFNDLGLSVMIIDYRGYGLSTGKPSEPGVYRDATAAWRWLTESRGVDPNRIILFGRSMGAAVASQLATRVQAAGLILESAFTSVPDLGAELYWWLPVRLLSRLEFNTADHIRRADLPTLIIHSPDDEIIPYSHGRQLHEAAGRNGTFLEIRGSHNTGFLDSGNPYREGLNGFISELTR